MNIEKTKRQLQREEDRKEAKKNPTGKFLEFSNKLFHKHHDEIVAELVTIFGAREPTPAQSAAGVTHGPYIAAEYNKACESLAIKAGIRVRKADDEVDLGEEVDETEPTI